MMLVKWKLVAHSTSARSLSLALAIGSRVYVGAFPTVGTMYALLGVQVR